MIRSLLALSTLLNAAIAAILWDGRFNDLSSSTDLNNWSWSNEVGPYQYYIHGSSSVTEYINLASTYKNPADAGSKQGAKFTIDNTSYWNGQTMRRTELIPQTSAAINSGKVFYHFSLKRSSTNAPSTALEHQVNFFESHFTEMKYGLLSGASGTSDPTLKWMVSQVTHWSATLDTDTWHNVAYEIDFSAKTVGFWHSTGSDDLVQVVAPISASTSSNGEDWHLGVLRLPGSSALNSPDVEDWYFSGVYIENGSITTSVSGPGGSSGGSSPSSSSKAATSTTTQATTFSTSTAPKTTTTIKSTTTTTSAAATTTAAAGPTVSHYGQCGGQGWTGGTVCQSPYTCVKSNNYYSQCL